MTRALNAALRPARRRKLGPPVLALDFDGVIAVNDDSGMVRATERLRPERVARLNEIVRRTGCRVVVSSSWRDFGVETLNEWLRAVGFAGEVAGVTPRFGGEGSVGEVEEHRGREILAWVEAQLVKPRALAVLDDLRLRGAVASVLVRTDDAVGLTDADVERVVALLSARGRRARPWEPARARRPSRPASAPRASTPASPGR